MDKKTFADRCREIRKPLWKAVRHILFHNGWVKLLALLISVVLWAGLISQDDTLTRDKTWQNVNVSVNGTETMKRNSFIVVTDMDELLSNVSVTAAVPQKQYETAEPTVYNLRIDLSRINSTGTQELKILSTNSSTYGKVTNTVPSVVKVEVEEYAVRQRIPVSVSISGEYQNGWYRDWYMPSPSVDPLLITVSGPRELVKSILMARVKLDPETLHWTEGTMQTTGEIRLYNRAGEEVDSPLMEITTEGTIIDTVLIEGNVLPAKSFDIKKLISLEDKIPEDYEITSVRVSPETIRVAARFEVLEQMDELTLAWKDEKELPGGKTFVFQLNVLKPSEDAVLSNETVTVTVEVEHK